MRRMKRDRKMSDIEKRLLLNDAVLKAIADPPRCGNCRFFAPHSDAALSLTGEKLLSGEIEFRPDKIGPFVFEWEGYCKRFPPIHTPPQQVDDPSEMDEIDYWSQPVVPWYDTCGEHQEAESSKFRWCRGQRLDQPGPQETDT